MRWTKTPDFVYVYRGISPTNRVFFHTSAACPRMPNLSQKDPSNRLVNTNTCNRSLFFASKLREPQKELMKTTAAKHFLKIQKDCPGWAALPAAYKIMLGDWAARR
jgi:hypothetical protein